MQGLSTCVASAGVSTAFAAPIGGLLLAIEEGASFLTLPLFWRGFLSTCTGVLTLHFLAQAHESGTGVLDSKFGIRRDLGCAPWLCTAKLAVMDARSVAESAQREVCLPSTARQHPSSLAA